MELTPREYQSKICESAKEKNTLVVLPTGMGKTMIALMLSMHRIEKFPKQKILFLAPTRPLVEQHFDYFKKNLPELYAELEFFTGKIDAKERHKLWYNTNIIFSTPQCIANDLKHGRISLEEVSLLIEDECHRCLKNYAYTVVAKKYLEQSSNPLILGMTASPGSDQKTIKQICENLEIENVELRSRYSEDVKPYIQELNIETINVELNSELKSIIRSIKEIHDKKVNELKNRKLLFANVTKKSLLELQARLGRMVSFGNKNFNNLRGLSVCSQAVKLHYLLELLETQSVYSSCNYMKNLMEQASKNQSRAVKEIVKSDNFSHSYVSLSNIKEEHPKISKLKEIIEEEIKGNKNAKIIVFSQYRDTGIAITNELSKIPDIKAKNFVGQKIQKHMDFRTQKTESFSGQKITKTSGLSQKEQGKVLAEFREGMINVIVATSIGEEGLDIPEVNLVVFYEPIPSAIRKIQRQGRTARLMPGKMITLIAKGTRDEGYHWASISREKKMYDILKSMKNSFDKKESKKHEQLNLNSFN
jgi:Fanconi anemia group M protein